MKVNLTARVVNSLAASAGTQQADYWDSGLTGFGIRVSQSGRKSWVVLYRHQGRLRRFTLGTYPTLSLADARKMAQAALLSAATGADPAGQRRSERRAETFADLADEYLERHARPNKKSCHEDERILRKDLLPRFSSWKAQNVTRKDVIRLLDCIVSRGAPIYANRVLALLRKMYNFGIQRDIVVLNPCQAVARPAPERARERVLSADEIAKVWAVLDRESPVIRAIFQIYFLTAQRGAEVRSMEWADLDLDAGWWTIPGEKTKNGLSHRVPLSPAARDIINSLRFVSRGRWVFESERLPGMHVDNVQKAIQRIRRASGVSWVGHDARRTAASHMTSLEVPRFVVARVLNHVEPGVTGVYDRYSYDKEKREALTLWADRLYQIANASHSRSVA